MRLQVSKLDQLWKEQRGMCWLCDNAMAPQRDGTPLSASFDHVIPRSHGGQKNSVYNLRLAHRSCNSKRGSPDPRVVLKDELGATMPKIAAAFRRHWRGQQR